MPIFLYGLAAGAVGWWWYAEEDTPAEDTNKTIRTLAVLAIVVLIFVFLNRRRAA